MFAFPFENYTFPLFSWEGGGGGRSQLKFNCVGCVFVVLGGFFSQRKVIFQKKACCDTSLEILTSVKFLFNLGHYSL